MMSLDQRMKNAIDILGMNRAKWVELPARTGVAERDVERRNFIDAYDLAIRSILGLNPEGDEPARFQIVQLEHGQRAMIDTESKSGLPVIVCDTIEEGIAKLIAPREPLAFAVLVNEKPHGMPFGTRPQADATCDYLRQKMLGDPVVRVVDLIEQKATL